MKRRSMLTGAPCGGRLPPGCIHVADVGVPDGGRSLRLAQKASFGLIVVKQVSGQKLHGDRPSESGAFRSEDFSHTAGAQTRDNLAPADGPPYQDGSISPPERLTSVRWRERWLE